MILWFVNDGSQSFDDGSVWLICDVVLFVLTISFGCGALTKEWTCCS